MCCSAGERAHPDTVWTRQALPVVAAVLSAVLVAPLCVLCGEPGVGRSPLDGKPMVSVLSRAPAGKAARRLVRSLKLRWESTRLGAAETGDATERPPAATTVRLDPPRQARVAIAGAQVAGAVGWYDDTAFELQVQGGKRVVRWRELEPAAVLEVHAGLLAEGTGERWLRAARLIASLPDGRLVANAALRLALEREAGLGGLPDFDRLHLHAYVAERCGEAIACPDLGADAGPYWRRTREQVAQAGERRRALYRVVGEHLLLADRYLPHQDRAVRLDAVGYAHDATYIAIRQLKDPLLGLAIADFVLLPHLDAADRDYTKPLSRQAVLNTAVAAYCEAGDHPRLVHALERLLAIAHNRNEADTARYRLAWFLAREGDCEAALRHLRQIAPSPRGQNGPRALMEALREKRGHPLPEERPPAP